MIVLLYGPDSARRIAKKREVIAELEKRYPSSVVEVFDFTAEDSADLLASFVRSQALFSAAKVAVVDSFSWDAGRAVKEMMKGCSSSSRTTVLVSASSAPPRGWEFLRKAPVAAQKFEYLTGAAWKSFLREEGKKCGLTFSPDALEKLARAYEKNTWGAKTEIQRAGCFGKKEVLPADIETPGEAGDAFPLALAFRNASAAAKTAALAHLLARGEPLPKVFFLIASLLPGKARLAAYDAAVKSGKLEWEEALLSLALTA